VIITTRPDATIPWDAQGHIETVALAPLSPGEVAWLVGSVMRGAHLDDERLGRIIERAEGVPLFAEELAWMMRDVGSAGAGVPHTLEDLLQARLDRLGPNLELARVCSVLGRDVPYTFVRAVTGADDASLRAALDALIDAGTMRVTGTGDEAVYTFRHALLRDAAYEALLRARRHEIHRRAADVLTSDHAAHVAARPETLAVHYAGAAMHAAAMDTWTWAATVAAERFAGPEAIDHLEAALALVPELDDPAEGVTRELRLLLTLGPVVFRIRGLGHPRMHEIYSRAETLCRMVGEGEDRFLALIGLRGYWAAKPDLRRVTELDAELERLAERLSRTWVFLQAHMAIGSLGYMAGDRVKAWDHLERCLTRYDPARPWRDAWDPGIVSMAFLGVMSWERGDLAAALGWFAQAEEVASRRQPFAVAYVGMLLSTFHARLGDPRLAREHAERTLALSTEYGFEQLVADSHCIEGWAIAVGGRPSIGIPLLETGLEEKRASGSFTQSSLHRALLAHALLLADDPDGALAVLDETNAFLETSGERFHEPEVLRLRGEALAALGRRAEAVESATSAHAVATRMGAPLLALRAALTAHRIGACARSVALVRSALDAVAGGDTPECEEARQLLTMGHTTLSVPAE